MMGRLLVTTGVVVMGIAALVMGDVPSPSATLPLAGFVLLPGSLILGVFLLIMTALTTVAIHGRLSAMVVFPPAWVVACMLLPSALVPTGRPAAVVAAAVGLPLAWATMGNPALARLRLFLLYLMMALISAGMISLHLRALMTAPVIGLAGALAALLVWNAEGPALRQIIRAGGVGLVSAEAAWALLYWPVPPMLAGTVIVMLWHGASGILGRELAGPALWVEYGLVAMVGIALALAVALHPR